MKLSGGRAFPKSDTISNGEVLYRDEGMTLRQWYAGQVLPAAIAHAYTISGAITNSATITKLQIAQKCFEMADAMIEEGNK